MIDLEHDEATKGVKVVDKRTERYEGGSSTPSTGQTTRRELDEKEKKLVEEKGKPKVIKMTRCPNCKANRPDSQYLYNPNLRFHICLECGAVFMDKEFANEVFKVSLEANRGVNVKAG